MSVVNPRRKRPARQRVGWLRWPYRMPLAVESSPGVAVFPSMKAGKFLSVLQREPLSYRGHPPEGISPHA